MQLSVVVPLYNEEQNVGPLIEIMRKALAGIDYELLLIDDGSVDKTVTQARLHADEHCKIIRLKRNFGQTAALAAGIDQATGTYCATMDGDLQNDPFDLPRMLALLQEHKVDMVVGRRAERQDGFFLRLLPSRFANRLIRRLTGVPVRDLGCSLKVFRTEVGQSLQLFGDMHRFVAILASMQGAEILEVDVKHHPRRFGHSKYGIGRTSKVLSDLILLVFWKKYRDKPIHLLGSLGLLSLGAGAVINMYLLVVRLMGHDIWGRPLLILGVLLLLAGLHFISFGVILDFLMRISFATHEQKAYSIREVLHGPEQVAHHPMVQNHLKLHARIPAL